jgi:hypothetical protein
MQYSKEYTFTRSSDTCTGVDFEFCDVKRPAKVRIGSRKRLSANNVTWLPKAFLLQVFAHASSCWESSFRINQPLFWSSIKLGDIRLVMLNSLFGLHHQ